MPQWPHEYVVRNWRPDKEPVFERFVMHIRDHGYDAPFLDHATYRYLEIDGWKYWTMGEALNETTIINRAKVEAAMHYKYARIPGATRRPAFPLCRELFGRAAHLTQCSRRLSNQ